MNISALSSTPTYPQIAQRLAASQTISSSSAVRGSLIIAASESNYLSPLEQAWSDLQGSLATGSLQGSGDLKAAKTAFDAYTQLLPSSSLYISSLTTPSAAFLKELSGLGDAINSGDLASAQAAFATAAYDGPENISNAAADAFASGNASDQATVVLEAAAHLAGYLSLIGYTESNARIEANAVILSGFTESPITNAAKDQAQAVKAAQQTTEIARLDATSAPTSNQLTAIEGSAMYNVYYAIFAADPFAVRDTNPNAYNERDAVLNQLVSSAADGINVSA